MEMIKKWSITQEYQESQNARARKSAFESKFEGYNCICLNGVGNSDVLGYLLYNYDIGILFIYNGKAKEWKYSLYTRRGDLLVNKICEKYGGGGHPQAAGFSSNKFLLN